jgi:hypothetical protein
VGGGWMLNANGKRGAAIAVPLILAVPGASSMPCSFC